VPVQYSVLEVSCLDATAYDLDELLVSYIMLQKRQKPFMIDCVKALPDVSFHYIIGLLMDRSQQCRYSQMAVPPLSESI
jgi:hypothetical protein